ncbi:hypothetical protein BDBG_05819 [Blastomyces gilchristii SLH14081]|uniref:Uncharacterized protein n=1 Tax=Blastomyces gilchristii (strain SLH14081) TaxID=559298 RepID=A0A179USY6_BLAGS|nr:uncharacterized protein BDBG_05819 [Blastomyces gilchristii SLH14081]OAT10141.1 hypothetical protein BDBG_05819 [Blastomyces gilchristii SLH14081]
MPSLARHHSRSTIHSKAMKPLFCLALLLAGVVFANVEKTIFTAPKPSPLQSYQDLFDDLEIERLSPQAPSIRTYALASFPSEEAPKGFENWFYLDSLKPGQRYEVRVCYLATQPTSFTLTTYTVSEILDSPSLISSLTTFSASHLPTLLERLDKDYRHNQQQHLAADEHPPSNPFALPPKLGHSSRQDASNRASTSALFLQVHAAADYFTVDKGLMENVPPVHVDVILDPYLFHLFPKSLLPTTVYILILAGIAWVISSFVWTGFEGVAGLSKKNKRDRENQLRQRSESGKKEI